MKIVIDTNVFISGIFFGGVPFDVLNTVISKKNEAYITPEMWDEYEDVIKRIAIKYPSHMKQELVDSLFKLFKIIIPSSRFHCAAIQTMINSSHVLLMPNASISFQVMMICFR